MTLAAALEKIRMAVIPNTLELSQLWVSGPLAELARNQAELKVVGEGRPLGFDKEGNLIQEALFPQSVRGRRCGSSR